MVADLDVVIPQNVLQSEEQFLQEALDIGSDQKCHKSQDAILDNESDRKLFGWSNQIRTARIGLETPEQVVDQCNYKLGDFVDHLCGVVRLDHILGR